MRVYAAVCVFVSFIFTIRAFEARRPADILVGLGATTVQAVLGYKLCVSGSTLRGR